MSQPKGFALSSDAAKRALYPFLLCVVAGFFLSLLVLPQALMAIDLSTDIFVCVVFAAAYIYLRYYKWVYLSNDALRGKNPWGMNPKSVSVSWDEPVSIRRRSYKNLQGFEVFAVAGKRSIFLPESIARSSDFVAVLRALAPEGHPLHAVVQVNRAGELPQSLDA